MKRAIALCAALAAILSIGLPARAETDSITVAKQFGVSFLPLLVMEHDKLVEKHAQQLGIPNLRADYKEFAGPAVINDGLLSGAVSFAAVGAPSLITLWTKSNGALKGVCAMTTYPLYLNVRNPALKSIKDFSDKDRIAIPAVKISTQAIVLQMAAAKTWGQENYARLDPLTISLSHPDGLIALKNGVNGIDAHFTTSPFNEEELKIPGVRTLFTSYDVFGGPATALTVVAASKFRDENPKAYRAFYDALNEAIAIVNKDKRAAAKLYVELTKGTTESPDDVYAVISKPNYQYTLAPAKVQATAEFMAKIGTISKTPSSWKEMFFPEVQNLRGD